MPTNPSITNAESDAVDILVLANRFQSLGYIRSHRAIIEDCGHAAAFVYGVLEDLAQLAARTKSELRPRHQYLAEASGRSVAQIKRDLASLRNAGWVDWKRTGRSCVFILSIAQNELADSSKRANAAVDTSNKQENTSNPAHARESVPERKHSGTTEQERHPEYWTAERLAGFDVYWSAYPKKVDKQQALTAWRTVLSTRLKDEEFLRAVATGFSRWIRYWREEETEVQYIISFARWIRNERWTLDPRGVAK